MNMSLFDRGFRLTAISILPISRTSIVYGSNDAGRVVHADDARGNQLMMQAAHLLNLKGHMVNTTMIHGPGDIEGMEMIANYVFIRTVLCILM
jgi:hypothetical protein